MHMFMIPLSPISREDEGLAWLLVDGQVRLCQFCRTA
jgi:hypothetical protein